MYSAHNEEKSAFDEWFCISTLNKKICNYITSISENAYIDKVDDIVNKFNNIYHSTIKMKPVDTKSKVKISNHVKISKHKNIFTKKYTPNWPEEVFLIKNVKNTVPWTYVIEDLHGEEIFGT